MARVDNTDKKARPGQIFASSSSSGGSSNDKNSINIGSNNM